MKKTDIDKEGLNEVIHLSKSLLRIAYVIFIVGIIICLLVIFKQLNLLNIILGILGVISPLFIGFILSWLFYPIQKKLVSKGMNKILSSIIIFTLTIALIFSALYFFVPVLYKQINELVTYIPTIISSMSNFISNTFSKLNINGLDTESIKQNMIATCDNYLVSFASSLPNGLLNLIKDFISALGVILISFVVGIYMLIDFDNLRLNIKKLLPKKNRDDYIKLFQNIEVNARRVVNGTLLVAFLVFVFDSLGFALVGLNSSLLFGLLCGITDLIPYIGPYIGGAAAVIVGFTQSPIIGLGVLIIAIIVQILESYILQPVVMSKAMQLHPVTIIVGLLVFGYLFGIVGMIIATPCMAIIKEIILFIKSKSYKIKRF